MKIWQTRMQQKHDIPNNWKLSSLVPLVGEIIIYDDRYFDSELNEVVIVAPAVRYKIGDGFTPVEKLPFADTSEALSNIDDLAKRIEKVASDGGLSKLTAVDGTIVLADTPDGGKSIGIAIASVESNALVAVEGGLFVPQLVAGSGIEIKNNEINLNLDTTHGLVAVDGKLTIDLATKTSDGAMSKEDKLALDTVVEDVKALKEDVAELEEGFQWGLW